MQSIEGGVWRALALQLAQAAWNGAEHSHLASLLGLGEPDDRPFLSDTRRDYPSFLTDHDVTEAVQRRITQTVGAEFAPFGMGSDDMPSQWADPTLVLGIPSLAEHGGVTEDAVRAAIRRGALRNVDIDGAPFARLADAERYFRGWDDFKSDRIAKEMRAERRLTIRDGLAFLVRR